jgi:hypothetical protein
MKKFSIAFLLVFVGCTDAGVSAFQAYGEAAHVVCHSGGKVIFDGCSTGRVLNSNQSDGYKFRDALTGRLVEVSGECFIDYGFACTKNSVRP